MINPFIKLTCVNDLPFYINVLKIQGYFPYVDEKNWKARAIISDILEPDLDVIIQETVEQLTALIQKYHDDCLLTSLTSAALSRTDSRVTDSVVMAKRVIGRLKESVSEGEENAP